MLLLVYLKSNPSRVQVAGISEKIRSYDDKN